MTASSETSPIAETISKLDTLPILISNNVVLGLEPVEETTLELAKNFCLKLQQLITSHGYIWHDPHVSTEGKGEVTLEWWHQFHTLGFFVEPDGATSFIRTWGSHMSNDMEWDDNPSDETMLRLWKDVFQLS